VRFLLIFIQKHTIREKLCAKGQRCKRRLVSTAYVILFFVVRVINHIKKTVLGGTNKLNLDNSMRLKCSPKTSASMKQAVIAVTSIMSLKRLEVVRNSPIFTNYLESASAYKLHNHTTPMVVIISPVNPQPSSESSPLA